MATDLGKAYVQIIPSAKGIGSSISQELSGECESAGKSAGFSIGSAIKTAIAAAGIGSALKSALEAGGNLQQSFGGLETLYGDAADAAKKYAVEAAKAGISANDYAEQAVSFGASLKQAFAGDTVAAAEAANTAILDMADNSAKMGTDIESIQNAYQGFAKQNYTMLDNLKLGYGGTKSEMERLLEDAEKLSGVHYDIENLGDVYSAIHVIQEDLGLTGVAAEEAGSTLTGSLASMKAAAENLMASLALGEDIRPALDTLSTTVRNFIFGNLFPMVSNILQAVPDLLSGLSGILIQSLNMISNDADQIVSIGLDIIMGLVEAIVEAAPYLAEAAVKLALALGDALINTDWIELGTNLMTSLKDSIDMAAGEIFGADNVTLESFVNGIMSGIGTVMETGGELLQGLYDGITSALPTILSTGVEILTQIQTGILENLPQLITTAGTLISQFVGFLLENLPTILSAGVELLVNLVQGIISALPEIVSAVLTVIGEFLNTILSNLPQILESGITILGELIAGLISAIPDLIAAIPQIIESIVDTFAAFDWASIGINLLEGIGNGIKGAVTGVVDAAKDAASAIWDGVTGFFGISSPSKLMAWAGQMIDEGLAQGIEDNTGLVDDAMSSLNTDVAADLTAPQSMEYSPSNTGSYDSKIDALISLLTDYLPAMANGSNVSVTLEGDAEGLFEVVKNQNKIYKRMNGESAFA